MRLSSSAYLFKQGIRNIWNNRIMSIASFCIMTVSLLMVGVTIIFTANINSFISDIEGKNEVVIFLDDGLDEERLNEIHNQLIATENIADVSFYSKEEAFEDLKKDIDDAEEIFSYLGEESPLPDAFRLKIKDISKMSSTLFAINSIENITKVKAPYDFVNVLTGLKTIVGMVSVLMLAALIIVSFVIISNTTRASVDIRKREIYIMKYVGATNTFVKIPFFIEGLAMGILAGIAASALTWIGYDKLVELLSAETTILSALSIDGFIPLESFIVYIVIGYIAIGAIISSVGTVFSTNKYVKV
ncbi:MAG: permease-like cell division protein FtsX [Huintestinicola sp.]